VAGRRGGGVDVTGEGDRLCARGGHLHHTVLHGGVPGVGEGRGETHARGDAIGPVLLQEVVPSAVHTTPAQQAFLPLTGAEQRRDGRLRQRVVAHLRLVVVPAFQVVVVRRDPVAQAAGLVGVAAEAHAEGLA